jgi:hypothetical protein
LYKHPFSKKTLLPEKKGGKRVCPDEAKAFFSEQPMR